MQKRVLILLLALIFLCGCNSKESDTNQDNIIFQQVPNTEADDEKNIPQVTVTEYLLPEEVAVLAKLQLKDIEFYVDEEQSMYNSNQQNFGYLASDEEGNIYFSDFNQNAIFMCGPEGENKERLYEGTGTCMYAASGYLYFGVIEPDEKYIEKVVKIDVHTKEVVSLYKELCGEVMFLQDTLYLDILGLGGIKLDEEVDKPIMLSEIEPVFFNSDGRYLFYNMITDDSRFLFERGYLLAWDTETETNYFVESKMVFPLLAGNWLSFVDLQTNTRHVLDMGTGEDIDLKYSIHHAVSDGHKLYWVQQNVGSFQVFRWEGREMEELFTIEKEKYSDVCLYLTEEYLYWMCETMLMEEAEWGYYRLADGKNGKLN